MTPKSHHVSSEAAYFPSKRDLWIVVVIWATAIVLIAATLDVIDSPAASIFKYVFAVACLAMVGLSIWILYSTGYTLTSDKLIARCGPFRNAVALDTIEAVSP